jgi:hypothetical protein
MDCVESSTRKKDYNPCVDIFIEIIKSEEENMSKQMKSHYKKQFIKMSEDEINKNLTYKLCLKIWEMEDDIKSYEGDIQRKNEIIQDLKIENSELKSQKI